MTAPEHEPRSTHEAVILGATAELNSEDTIAASPRDLAVQLARGAPLRALLAADGAAGSISCWSHPIAPEDPFHAGVGIALAHKLEHKRRVVVALCAQPHPALSFRNDALRFAARHQLPILFVIESGGEPHEPAHDTPAYLQSVSFLVRGHNFPGIVVDGSDVVAVWRVAQEAVHRARNGLGPTLIDCRTDAAAHDPLAHMEHYLRKRNLWEDAWRQNLELEIASAIAEAMFSKSIR